MSEETTKILAAMLTAGREKFECVLENASEYGVVLFLNQLSDHKKRALLNEIELKMNRIKKSIFDES